MTAGSVKIRWQLELSELFSRQEISELFSIFAEKILGKTKWEMKFLNDFQLSEEQYSAFENALHQLETGKPYQYILGEAEFFGLKFFVDENVLIPRPETEELLELAIPKIREKIKMGQEDITVLDIGTGSGIIPIVLKKHFPGATISALDLSAGALETAKKNAALHKTEIHFFQADYLSFEPHGQFDVIISNPPYIGIGEADDILASVKEFEPLSALFPPDKDPLIFYRKIAADGRKFLKKNGMIFLEINQKFGQETLALFGNYVEKKLLKDLSGNDRMIFVKR